MTDQSMNAIHIYGTNYCQSATVLKSVVKYACQCNWTVQKSILWDTYICSHNGTQSVHKVHLRHVFGRCKCVCVYVCVCKCISFILHITIKVIC